MKTDWLIAPERPVAHFVGRKAELEELTAALTSGKSVAIAALQGMGGIGKTALALQLANELKKNFPGGVLWAKLGQRPDVYGILGRWAEAAGGSVAEVTDLAVAEADARSWHSGIQYWRYWMISGTMNLPIC